MIDTIAHMLIPCPSQQNSNMVCGYFTCGCRCLWLTDLAGIIPFPDILRLEHKVAFGRLRHFTSYSYLQPVFFLKFCDESDVASLRPLCELRVLSPLDEGSMRACFVERVASSGFAIVEQCSGKKLHSTILNLCGYTESLFKKDP